MKKIGGEWSLTECMKQQGGREGQHVLCHLTDQPFTQSMEACKDSFCLVFLAILPHIHDQIFSRADGELVSAEEDIAKPKSDVGSGNEETDPLVRNTASLLRNPQASLPCEEGSVSLRSCHDADGVAVGLVVALALSLSSLFSETRNCDHTTGVRVEQCIQKDPRRQKCIRLGYPKWCWS